MLKPFVAFQWMHRSECSYSFSFKYGHPIVIRTCFVWISRPLKCRSGLEAAVCPLNIAAAVLSWTIEIIRCRLMIVFALSFFSILLGGSGLKRGPLFRDIPDDHRILLRKNIVQRQPRLLRWKQRRTHRMRRSVANKHLLRLVHTKSALVLGCSIFRKITM